MSPNLDSRLAVISQLQALARERHPGEEGEGIGRFLSQYFSRVPEDILLERREQDLYAQALSHRHLLIDQASGPSVRVYNPRADEDGWESRHTVAQIVVDDMPFLVDSLGMAINRVGLTIHHAAYPRFSSARFPSAQLPVEGEGEVERVLLHFEMDRRTDAGFLQSLQDELLFVLAYVEGAYRDWRGMRDHMQGLVEELKRLHEDHGTEILAETKAFLEWIMNDHFTFLGYREYRLTGEEDDLQLEAAPGSELGTARLAGRDGFSETFAALPGEMREQFRDPVPLVLTKTKTRSRVHRPVHLDYIGVKRFGEDGQVVGEHRFLGLYSAAFYNCNPRDIPLVRTKIAVALQRSGIAPDGHDGKTLQYILDTYPRDELLQIGPEELHRNALSILYLAQRQRLRLFARQEPFGRFVTCLIYVPRDRFGTELRKRINAVLMEEFEGVSSDFRVSFGEGPFAQVYFMIHTPPGHLAKLDCDALEARIAQLARVWKDDLAEALVEHYGEEKGSFLLTRYADAFPAGYREDFDARTAVWDIDPVDKAAESGRLGLTLYRYLEDPEGTLRFKLYAPGAPLTLSDVLPVLENMGVRVAGEKPYKIAALDADPVYLHDFSLQHRADGKLKALDLRHKFQECFARIWRGDAESDGFNRLVLLAGLDWREITLLRAQARYLRQTGLPFSLNYMETTLAREPAIAGKLVSLFHARFQPGSRESAEERPARLLEEIQGDLESVDSLDTDRILRAFLALNQATLRTNYYQCTGRHTGGQKEFRTYLSMKLDPKRVPDLPEPRPTYEIFVYSPRVEGVHLRGGAVARGGLRWSDRPEDFRTEVLGLVKAQMVKNSIIVPMGSKGGFIVRHPPSEGGREALTAEAIACYKTFIRGLLDLTDNLDGAEVIPPRDVVRYDGDDPYLVVAADKGTATFSDIANEVAAEYGFWLGDAFASGGKHGYDHKKMGITARGGWEAVKRHFREMGRDIQSEPFTVVGIGDMFGDVFGNGMLLSRQIKLVAAFDHRHIFIDPDPNPETGYRERERLFHLPRSSWDDYNRDLIGKGGGVYARSRKSIVLSHEAAEALGTQARRLTPLELLKEILKAPVDLLWNGGIGTYVKAESESHTEVGDRANDAIRIDGRELRCRVVGEGGNLGLTQRGRVEYALHGGRGGGRVNTDFIDNAGGVNCSDHEVNIKILLNVAIADGDLTLKQRNRMLEEMTEEVGRLVDEENYWQTGAITFMANKAHVLLDEHAQFIRQFEHEGLLDRELEFLPGEEEIMERKAAGRGLTRPELAVLVAYAKNALYTELLKSDAPEDSFLQRQLVRYFPQPLRMPYRERMGQHRLRRELIVTYTVNRMINRLGATFAFRLRDQYGFGVPAITMAYLTAWEIFDLRSIWQEVAELDNRVDGAVQADLFVDAVRLIHQATRWILRHHPKLSGIAETAGLYGPCAEFLLTDIQEVLTESQLQTLQERIRPLVSAGVPETLALNVASLGIVFAALAIYQVAEKTGSDRKQVACVYFELSDALFIDWLRNRISAMELADRWEENARMALYEDMESLQGELTQSVMECNGEDGACVRAWLAGRGEGLVRYKAVVEELDACDKLDVAKASVVVRALRNLQLR